MLEKQIYIYIYEFGWKIEIRYLVAPCQYMFRLARARKAAKLQSRSASSRGENALHCVCDHQTQATESDS